MSLFSVIIPAYNMGRYIGEALISVAAQTCRDWEVIVVDDCGPEDGTEEIVRDFAKGHPDHRIEFIRHQRNTGVSGARNTAMAAARGTFLAFLDPDDYWLPEYLREMENTLAITPPADVVSSPINAFRIIDGKMVNDPIPFQKWQIGSFPDSLAVSCFMQPSATVARREAVNALGGFDTDPLIQHIEDYDLWIRLVQNGNRFRFINQMMCRYRKHPAAATSDAENMERLHNYLVAKHSLFFTQSQTRIIRLLMSKLTIAQMAMTNPLAFLLRRLRAFTRS